MVMLVGQYSTGKTTFIRYLLEQDFPGIRIGPEPTTDRYRTVRGVVTCNSLPRQGWAMVFNRPPRIRIGTQLLKERYREQFTRFEDWTRVLNRAIPIGTGCSLPLINIISDDRYRYRGHFFWYQDWVGNRNWEVGTVQFLFLPCL